MRKKVLIFFFTAAIFYAGCSTGYIGKTLPTNSLCKLSNSSNTCTLKGGTRLIYRVEGQKLVGDLIFAERPHSAGYEIVSFTLVAWFADGSGLVCAKSSCSWSHSDNLTIKDKLEFNIDIPEGFKNLQYVGFTYHGTTAS